MEKTHQSEVVKWKVEAGWLDGVWYDSIFIFGVLGIAIISGLVVFLEPNLFHPVLAIDVLFLGYHHVIATFTKLAGTAEDRSENAFLIYILPLIVAAGVIFLYYVFGAWVIATTYFFCQWFHYTRQAYGIEVFYRRKSKQLPQKNTVLSLLAIWSIPIWGLLHRCSQGWKEFLSIELYMPTVPEWLVTTAGVVAITSVFFWIVSKINEYRLGILSVAQTSFVASHMLIFYFGYVLISEINTGWLAINIWHNAQYIMFVWLFNVNRFGKTVKTESVSNMKLTSNRKPIKIMPFISNRKPVQILWYFGFTLAMTVVFYSVMNTGFQFVSSSTGILLANGCSLELC